MESCSENFRNFQKKICGEFLFGKDDIVRSLLKMEISRAAKPNKACKELVQKSY